MKRFSQVRSTQWSLEYIANEYSPTELQHQISSFQRRPNIYVPYASNRTVSEKFGFLLVGLCLMLTGFSLMAMTTHFAERWSSYIHKEMHNVEISRWHF
ncbi:MAG: hypothetical protein AAGD25_26635 [Cyanobacteria bacterium P01_F01_bin.150]